eukprot:UN02839
MKILHKCYATPSDRDTNKKSFCWLPLGKRADNCLFEHRGPCLAMIKRQTKTVSRKNRGLDLTSSTT